MRTKKDSGIRQEAFICAATELFMEKGYEAVSVRDVLDAVADKTASPSVFYYYFSSKDELYHACVETVAENYLSALQAAFYTDGKSMEEWMLALVISLEDYLMSERNLIMTGSSTPNRLFILDMREHVTKQVIQLWAVSLSEFFPSSKAHRLSQFLAGGIGEMLFTFLLSNQCSNKTMYSFAEDIVCFAINTLGFSAEQKTHLISVLEEYHRKAYGNGYIERSRGYSGSI